MPRPGHPGAAFLFYANNFTIVWAVFRMGISKTEEFLTEDGAMFKTWMEQFSEKMSPLGVTSIFASALLPSLLLIYTGTYNLYIHLIILFILAACYTALLLHVLGYKSRTERERRRRN
jgi:hypothetical protein